ncbi:hypothetical protein [Cronobacter phage vB_Cdu_VP8]|nr:hypothetical protein [Cronobacter phage vB_Cdu_VP8]
MKFTKHQITKLLATSPKVALINGLYQRYEWKLVFSRYAITINLKVTHPSLMLHAGMKKPAEWSTIVWTTRAAHTGTTYESLPEGIEEWASCMEAIYEMGQSQADALLTEWTQAWKEYSEAMGIQSK